MGRHRRSSKWSAFYLSLAVPGLGQLYAGSPTCLMWGIATLLWPTIVHPIFPGDVGKLIQYLTLVPLSIAAAEDAKRRIERRLFPTGSDAVRATECHDRSRRNTVDVRIKLIVDRPHKALWSVISDVQRFMCIDPFHETLTLQRPLQNGKIPLIIRHTIFGCSFERFGYLSQWRQNRGYTVSDLPRHKSLYQFPHIFVVFLRELTPSTSQLDIVVRGRWRVPLLFRPLRRIWVMYVIRDHIRLLKGAL